MVKIGCHLNLSGEGLPSWVIRSKSYSHTTHIKFFHALHDLCIPLAPYCYALVSNLYVNKQKIEPC